MSDHESTYLGQGTMETRRIRFARLRGTLPWEATITLPGGITLGTRARTADTAEQAAKRMVQTMFGIHMEPTFIRTTPEE